MKLNFNLLTVPLLAVFISTAEAALTQSQPPPLGQLIDVDGHRVHLYCTGDGAPTIVVASGGFSFDWGLVQPKIAQLTRICTYDTAGTAWSDKVEGQEHPTCSDRVNELHALLKNAGIDGPYVLVGFSIGGLIARLYAARYPTEVSGMVLVDHAFVDTGVDSSPPAPASVSEAGLDSPPIPIYKAPIVLDLVDNQNFSKLPERDQELHRWALAIHSVRPTAEMAAAYFSEVAAVERKPFPLGNRPLAVISTLYDSPHYKDLQHTLLMLSRDSKQFVAENSTHMVIIDQPEIVVQAIRELIAAVRDHKPLNR